MYLLKKLTNFTKTGNADGVESSSNASACNNSNNGKDDEIAKETSKSVGERDAHDGMKADSNSRGSSNPSIPDCFFDDLPETTPSEMTSSEESQDSDSRDDTEPLGDVLPDKNGNEDSAQVENALSATVSSTDIVNSPQNSNEIADLIDFSNNGNNGHAVTKESELLECDITHTPQMEEFHDEQPMKVELEISENDASTYLGNEFSLENVKVLVDSLEPNESSALSKKDAPVEADGDNDGISQSEGHNHRTSTSDCIEDYLDKENDKAEARLAARRQARVEAREIRLRELERQQKEQEENADRAFDMSYAGDTILRTGRATPSTMLNARDRSLGTNSYHSSRRSSEDSIEEGLTLRDIRHELKEAEEKFKKAMIANAQLDNEKSALAYQVELLKDRFEDLEETHAQLSREHRDKCREHEQLKRAAVKLKEDLEFYKTNLMERDRLISECGLVIVDGDEDGDGKPKRTLVSAESAELLQQAGCGSLDVRLKKFSEERNDLLDEIRHLKLELEEERSKRIPDSRSGSLTNGPLDEETSKILSDYKFKLQKAEQDVSTLQANVARLESQVIRYKTAAESSEKAEDELKIERRKLQRENRESIARIEELETANSHLQRRMDKLKNAKSTLLKEL